MVNLYKICWSWWYCLLCQRQACQEGLFIYFRFRRTFFFSKNRFRYHSFPAIFWKLHSCMVSEGLSSDCASSPDDFAACMIRIFCGRQMDLRFDRLYRSMLTSSVLIPRSPVSRSGQRRKWAKIFQIACTVALARWSKNRENSCWKATVQAICSRLLAVALARWSKNRENSCWKSRSSIIWKSGSSKVSRQG